MENDINYVKKISEQMGRYSDVPSEYDSVLFSEILRYSPEKILAIRKEIAESGLNGSIRILRYVVAEKLLKGEIVTPNGFQSQIEEIKYNFNANNLDYFKPYIEQHAYAAHFILNNKNDAFRNWGAYYRYLLPFVYPSSTKNEVWAALKRIINTVLEELHIENLYECNNSQDFGKQIRSFYGFEGPSNYGSQRAVIMIHPKNIPDHKNSIQLVCYFYKGIIDVGYDTGWTLRHEKSDVLEKLNWDELQFLEPAADSAGIVQVLKKVLPTVYKINSRLLMHIDAASTIIERNAETEEDSDVSVNLFVDKNGTVEKASEKIESIRLAKQPEATEDYFDRKKYASTLAKIIKNPENKPPISIGIYGRWGEGKTQLINLIEKECGSDIKFIKFDAWQYDDQEHIWAAMISRFMQECKSDFIFYLAYLKLKASKIFSYETAFKILIYLAILVISPLLIRDLPSKLSFIFNHPVLFALIFTFVPNLIKNYSLNIEDNFLDCLNTPKYKEHLGFRQEISEYIDLTLNYLTKNGRVVLCVDNLDRCSKDNIVKILDAICQFLAICTENKKVPNIATLFALDDGIIKNAIKQKFANEHFKSEEDVDKKAEEYLDKIINIPFRIPVAESIKDYIENVISLESENKDKIIKIFELIYKEKNCSPRELHKIINKFLLFCENDAQNRSVVEQAALFARNYLTLAELARVLPIEEVAGMEQWVGLSEKL